MTRRTEAGHPSPTEKALAEIDEAISRSVQTQVSRFNFDETAFKQVVAMYLDGKTETAWKRTLGLTADESDDGDHGGEA